MITICVYSSNVQERNTFLTDPNIRNKKKLQAEKICLAIESYKTPKILALSWSFIIITIIMFIMMIILLPSIAQYISTIFFISLAIYWIYVIFMSNKISNHKSWLKEQSINLEILIKSLRSEEKRILSRQQINSYKDTQGWRYMKVQERLSKTDEEKEKHISEKKSEIESNERNFQQTQHILDEIKHTIDICEAIQITINQLKSQLDKELSKIAFIIAVIKVFTTIMSFILNSTVDTKNNKDIKYKKHYYKKKYHPELQKIRNKKKIKQKIKEKLRKKRNKYRS